VASDIGSEEEGVLSSASSNDGSAEAAPASKSQSAGKKSLTTIIIKNLPEWYTRERIIALLEQHGLRARCNFLYLPVDLNTGKTLGYVILNFLTTDAAELCNTCVNREQVSLCGEFGRSSAGASYEAVWASTQQGLRANIRRYRDNAVMHSSVPDEYKPILLSEGERIPFPPPRRSIRRPLDRVERTHCTATDSIMTAI